MMRSLCTLLAFAVSSYASPILPRQAVTSQISPSQPPPPGCTGSFPSGFGIAVMNITLPSHTTSPEISFPAPSSTPDLSEPYLQKSQLSTSSVMTVGEVNQINDGQVQGGMHTVPLSFINPTTSSSLQVTTMVHVTQIEDGQIQGPMAINAQTGGSTTCPDLPSISPTVLPKIGQEGVDPSAQATCPPSTEPERACGVPSRGALAPTSTVGSSQDQISGAPLSTAVGTGLSAPTRKTGPPATFLIDSSSTASPSAEPTGTAQTGLDARLSFVSCQTNSSLVLRLQDNNLYDSLNRTGYIASNYQFQFDGPPQSGAIYTSGWSICPAGSTDGDSPEDGVYALALGGTTTFWQCLSGDFYNLYTENWAAQCNPVQLRITRFVECDP